MTMIFASWVAVILFFKLSVIVGRKLGLSILPQEEIPFYPFRLNWNKIIFISVELFCRVQLPECFDMRRSDFIIPNGLYSDMILLVWGIMALTMMYLGMWKLVFVSLPAVVCTLKVVDVVGKKFGYNLLRTNQEMFFYPIRFNNIHNNKLNRKLFSSTRILTVNNFIMPRGFSFNLALLTWAIASGFLLEFFESLLLTGQMKPKFEGFVNTRRDLIDKGMTLGRVEYLIEYQIIIMLIIQFFGLINNGL